MAKEKLVTNVPGEACKSARGPRTCSTKKLVRGPVFDGGGRTPAANTGTRVGVGVGVDDAGMRVEVGVEFASAGLVDTGVS